MGALSLNWLLEWSLRPMKNNPKTSGSDLFLQRFFIHKYFVLAFFLSNLLSAMVGLRLERAIIVCEKTISLLFKC